MIVKESSDELNPPVKTGPKVSAAHGDRGATDYLALGIATCGVGYLPVAPGTWGSLLGVGLYFLIRFLYLSWGQTGRVGFLVIELTAITAITLAGVWAGTRTEQLLGRKDPGKVVIDEVAGQLISLIPISLLILRPDVWLVMIAFVSFRVFDIIKPFPARRFESLKSGWGIMADDLVAGVYAAIVVAFASMVLDRMV
jgi:phosphatidylglycerophosphatase A